ncbi:MAG: hypothetical protein GY898_20025 [Proteobacteria bacterium]|nr:hypothetical protein [Pseudomonadota bacterium]
MHNLTLTRLAALCALLMALLASGCEAQITSDPLLSDDDDDTNTSDDDDANGDDDDDDDDDDDSVPQSDDDDDDINDDDDDDDINDDDDDDDSVPEGDDDDSDEPVGDDDDDEGGTCAPTEEATCGWSVSATTADATNAIDSYPCSSWDATGPEVAYTFVPTESGSVTAAMSDIQAGQDLDLYILVDEGAGCDSNTCYAYGNMDATFDVVAGETYYLVVDGYYGAAGTFSLDLTCGDDVPVGDDDDDDDTPVGDDDDDDTPGVDLEDCTDGIDNNGNGDVDCDDWTCEGDAACPTEPTEPIEGVCSPDVTIAAGEVDSWANNEQGSTNAISAYNCVAWDESGPEYTYSYTAAVTGQATVNISLIADEIIEFVFGPQEDLDLFILDGNGGCAGDTCVAYGDDTVSWDVTAGSTWYIVVDGHQGDASPYDLTLTVVETAPPAPTVEEDCTDGLDDDGDGITDCDDTDCATDATCNENVCIPSRVLNCGQTDSWNNDGFGSWNFVDSYGCNSWNESGPEYSYLFTAPNTGSVTASLANMDADLDVFIVGSTDGQCDTDGACMVYGNTDATFDVVAGQQYHVVVDGFNGAISDYDLTLSCN